MGELALAEPEKPDKFADRELFSTYYRARETWRRDVRTAHALGLTIRMHAPVRLEAFVNLAILVLRNETLRLDKRLFESRIREQIDLRVRSLHLNCRGFEHALDIMSEQFLNFRS